MDPTQSNDGTVVVPPVAPVVPDAVQARFNELTAQRHETERQMQQMNQNMQELMAQNAAMALRMSAPVAPQGPTIPEGVDPTIYNSILEANKQMMGQQLEGFKKEMGNMLGQVRASQAQTELQQALQGVPAEVQKVANTLYTDWNRKGLQGFNAQDAVIHARGILATQKENQARQNMPNGDGSNAVTQGGSYVAPPTNPNLPPAKTDAELKKMSLAQQEAYWAGRVGDSPLQY